ncbi:hypothetical protein KCP75_22330 [Salmonella enterica subsp. enterica]|nr:hypothetical protein KCP75_22330 [Salmonella enterica subsp. enterica]
MRRDETGWNNAPTRQRQRYQRASAAGWRRKHVIRSGSCAKAAGEMGRSGNPQHPAGPHQ